MDAAAGWAATRRADRAGQARPGRQGDLATSPGRGAARWGAMVIWLEPWLGDVPDRTLARIRSARRVLAVGHENPDADTIGGTLAIATIIETLGGRATVMCSDPIPPLYAFIPGVEAFRTDPDPGETYDLLVISDCGGLDRIGSVYERHRELIDSPAASDPRPPRVDPRGRPGGLGGSPSRRHLRDDHPPGTAARRAARRRPSGDLAAALMAGLVMDTATFAHPNATPRTLAVAAALVEAGAPLSDISRRLYRTKPTAQLRLFGRVLAGSSRPAGGRCPFHAARGRPGRDGDHRCPLGGDHRPAVAGRGGGHRDPVQGGRGPPPGSASAHGPAASMRRC